MTQRTYGYRYAEAENKSDAEVAKLIRHDIKQAQQEGLLPGSPVQYSVRCRDHLSIDVTVRNFPGEVWVELPEGSWPPRQMTPEAEAVKMTLERIHGAYNHDGSDIMTDYFDVRYYGQVSFEDPRGAEWRARERERLAQRRAALDAAAEAGARRVIVYGRGGKRTVHDAVEVDGKVRLVCGATLWRGSLVGDGGERTLTCSRCAKRAAQ